MKTFQPAIKWSGSKRKQVQVPIEKIQEQDRFIEAIAEKN